MRKLLLVVLALLGAMPGVAQEKRRVAVLDFGYGTVMTSVQAIFGSNQDVGKGISDLLINQLVNDGTYRVIERSAIDKIVKEQNFSNSDRANSATAAKIAACSAWIRSLSGMSPNSAGMTSITAAEAGAGASGP